MVSVVYLIIISQHCLIYLGNWGKTPHDRHTKSFASLLLMDGGGTSTKNNNKKIISQSCKIPTHLLGLCLRSSGVEGGQPENEAGERKGPIPAGRGGARATPEEGSRPLRPERDGNHRRDPDHGKFGFTSRLG